MLPIPSITAPRRQVTALAAKHQLPAMYALRDDIDAGGLMAYAPNYPVLFRRAADYVDRILKGAKPADLPIEQMTQFELVVNLKTHDSTVSPDSSRRAHPVMDRRAFITAIGGTRDTLKEIDAAAPSLRLRPVAIPVRSRDDFGDAFSAITRAHVDMRFS